jgi:uncharacterized protein (DUF58 family)
MRFLKRFRRTSRGTTARVTGYFWVLVALIVALFLEAYMHNFNIVYISLFFLVGFGIVSEFMGRANLARIGARLLRCSRVFAKRPADYTVALKNGADAPSYGVRAENGSSVVEVGRIAARATEIVTLSCTFGQRGRTVLPATELSSSYPLPHLRFGKRFEHDRELVVCPEPRGEPLRDLLARNRSLSGERDDFDGIRKYENGDTASLIYWPSVAKGETVMSKQFLLDEPSRKLQFVFSECGADDESRLSQLTLWVLECEKAALPFVITMPGMTLDSRERGTDEILEILALY